MRLLFPALMSVALSVQGCSPRLDAGVSYQSPNPSTTSYSGSWSASEQPSRIDDDVGNGADSAAAVIGASRRGQSLMLSNGQMIMHMGGRDFMNMTTGEMYMYMGGGDYMNTNTGAILMHMGGGDYMNSQTGSMLMHMGRGDYLDTKSGLMIINLGKGMVMGVGGSDPEEN